MKRVAFCQQSICPTATFAAPCASDASQPARSPADEDPRRGRDHARYVLAAPAAKATATPRLVSIRPYPAIAFRIYSIYPEGINDEEQGQGGNDAATTNRSAFAITYQIRTADDVVWILDIREIFVG